MAKPIPGTYSPFLHKYICMVEAETLQEAIEKYSEQLTTFFSSIPDGKVDYSYAIGKWTVKEMLQHIIDTDRIFAYRAMCIARKDATPFPSFDENSYAQHSKANSRSWQSLLQDLQACRTATDAMLLSLDEEQLAQSGTTSNATNSVLSIGYAILGHLLHHKNILQERYLQ